ncbi:ATP-binding cassette domain-containing protein [Terriglobus roseus]|uniref:Osmoprotectant transport system ATP-binding protein n=1 Tax=Terriglobus roseus TaxID=392734 RepID=A0A1G7JRV3_9BACT|nr:ATP-binding cassette domain-containing protein [Terriglobus roseus]SDF27179.1 osmoprotectant transport system ATP-binding protein [Terriglobus roseus]
MNGAAIEIRDVVVKAAPSRSYSGEGVVILNGISLKLSAGTTTALLGRSGSGKTTLLRTINGLVSPTSGIVLVDGEVVGKGDLLALRHRIGYVIQETGLYPHLTIERNVAMPLELAGKPLAERQSRARELLAMTGLDPSKFADRMPWQLSGGQRQRAGVARALAADPAILLLDEPFGALDPLTRAEMQTMLRDLLKKLQKTAVIVTHDLQEAVFLADRVLLVDKGSIVADLPSRDVLHSQIPEVKEYVAAVQRFVEAEA